MYNKKALRTIVNNLDKAKAPAKPKDIITDPMGQWKYPGQKTRIRGGKITMQGVPYPVWAQPNVGPGVAMQPGQDYNFPGADYVDETPMAKKGGSLKKYSRSLEAKNKIFVDNPLTKKPKSKKKKIFDPTSKNYKNGGVNETPSLPLRAGRDVYETFAYGMYDRPGWQKQDGGEAWEDELTDEEIQAYRDGGYVVEDLEDNSFQQGGSSGSYFTVPGSKGVYKKVNGKWQVDWNRSGNFQPLSKGDVAKRTAVLNKQAKPLYDRDYNSLVESRSYVAAPKKVASQPQTATQKKAQQNFNQNFKVSAKDNYTKVKDRIDSDKEKLLQWSAENNVPIDQKQLDDYETWGWNVYGKVGAQHKPDEIHTFNPEAPQGFLDKTADVLSNPMTSLGFFLGGRDIPDYMQRDMDRGTFAYYGNGVLHTERNPFDYVADFTPLGLINDTRNIVNGIAEGDGSKIGMAAAGMIPGVSELRSVSKAANLGSKASKIVKPLGKAVKPITKNSQRFVDKFYTGMGQGTINKYSPLNLIPGYGKKLSNPTVAAGNVLDDVVKSGNVVSSQSPLSKAYREIIKEANPQLKVSKKPLYNSGKSIFQLETRPNVVGSKLSYATEPTSRFARTKGLNYNNVPASQIPLSDPGATLYRRLPFSKRVVRVDPIKLANNQAQWATKGAGLQNLIEKYGSTALGSGLLAAGVAGRDVGYKNAFGYGVDAANPYTYLTDINPYMIKDFKEVFDYVKGKQTGGAIEMEADDDMIEYLRSQGYTVDDMTKLFKFIF